MKRIAVFCGSSPGKRVEYTQAARRLGATLAGRNIGLVYGGGSVGLMHAVAQAVLDAGGEVIGVIPQALFEMEVGKIELNDLRVVRDMHERKALMADLSDGFIAMPGGLGTLEEFFEALTWTQLGFHAKPCGLYNIDGFYDHLLGFLDHVTAEGFVKEAHRSIVLVDDDPDALVDKLAAFKRPDVDKVAWVKELKEQSG